jgi:phosphoglycolate phosphatase-like HAD superfamily hydrolase
MVASGGEVWVFDVDGCLIDSLTGTSLRPGATELLTLLDRRGARLVLWSAGGGDYARLRAEAHGIDELFDLFAAKDTRDSDGRYRADHLIGGAARVVFVDDRPEDMPVGSAVVAVSPYLAPHPHDRGLDRVRREATRPDRSDRPDRRPDTPDGPDPLDDRE